MKTARIRQLLLLAVLGGLVWQYKSELDFGAQALAQELNPDFRAVKVVDDLNTPWGLAFLPNGDMLVTERAGKLRLVSNGRLLDETIKGVPKIRAVGQGGLLDVVLDPNFSENRWVYLSYSAEDADGGIGTRVGRGQLDGMSLGSWQQLYAMEKNTSKGHHFGSRLVFDRDGRLFITVGDRGERNRAQHSSDSAGSVLRIRADGTSIPDNPWAKGDAPLPIIYSYGHRNSQGAAIHPESGQLWIHEHGPQGGDELNIIKPGANYGWPVITYGREYGTGFQIGEGTARADIEAPIYYWVPSIAPSGMAFYTGDKIPGWQGSLFVGSLKFTSLVRLELDGDRVVAEERYLQGKLGRIRDVRNGPDGYLYILTNSDNSGIYRLEPPQPN